LFANYLKFIIVLFARICDGYDFAKQFEKNRSIFVYTM